MNQFIRQYRPLLWGEKIEVAFLFQAGTVWPSLESVYEACVANPFFDVKLIYVSETAVEVSHSAHAADFLENKCLDFVYYEDIDFCHYIPHVVFVQFPYDTAFHTPETLSLQFVKRGSRVVYVPYGIEIADTPIARKDHFESRVVENAWRIYTSSEGIKAEYDKYCRNRQAVRVSGSPKFDAINSREVFLMNDDYIRQANGRKIIVWKMHFPKKNVIDGKKYLITPELGEYIKFANRLQEFDDFFFVVMPHPKMLGKMVESDLQGENSLVQQVNELMKVIRSKENVVIDSFDDYRYSLYNADAIIMDRSAVMVEAAMLNVPILILRNEAFSEPMVLPVKEVIESCEQGSSCEDMYVFLEELRNNIHISSTDRKKCIGKWFPFTDGNCGLRIAEDIRASILEEKPAVVPKVIMYGTGEVASYYMGEQHWDSPEKFELVAVVDSNSNKWGKPFYGNEIIGPHQIVDLDFDVIVVMTDVYYYEIKKKLVYDLYLDERKIVRLDEFVIAIGR